MEYDGSTQICGVPEWQHKDLIEIERAHNLGVCNLAIIKKGCFKDVEKRLGGNLLIDDSHKLHQANYSRNMHKLVPPSSYLYT